MKIFLTIAFLVLFALMSTARADILRYQATVIQTGTNTPIAQRVFEDTIGTLGWSYMGLGHYALKLNNDWESNQAQNVFLGQQTFASVGAHYATFAKAFAENNEDLGGTSVTLYVTQMSKWDGEWTSATPADWDNSGTMYIDVSLYTDGSAILAPSIR